MKVHKYVTRLLVFLAFLSLLLLIGCGNSRPDFEEVITQAEAASNNLNSYRIEMTVTYTENEKVTHSSGLIEVVSPDSLRTVTEGHNGISESIRIGQTEYLLDEVSNEWQVRQWPESLPIDNMVVLSVESLGALLEIVDMADEEIDGVECYHYKGRVDWEAKIEEQKAGLDQSQPGYKEQLKSVELQRQWQSDSEFWIGKEDYLLRQLKQHQEGVFIRDAGKETEKEEHLNTNATFRFFDFNAPIQIEPPVADMVEGIDISINSVSSIGGKDLEHQQIKYEIIIGNSGIETARDVRVFVDSPATNQGWQTMEAEPSQEPVNLGPNEHETYLITWEYDLTESSKEELTDLMKENVIRATWIDENGQQQEEELTQGR